MSELTAGEITRLLRAWRDGDAAALDALAPLVYSELHRLARVYMHMESMSAMYCSRPTL
jgi:hypothetical protein